MNIFTPGANKGTVFDGVGQMIVNMSFPVANYYIDCGYLLTANIGSCYMNETGEGIVFGSDCSKEYSYHFMSKSMAARNAGTKVDSGAKTP